MRASQGDTLVLLRFIEDFMKGLVHHPATNLRENCMYKDMLVCVWSDKLPDVFAFV